MKHKHLVGKVGHVVERKFDTFTCLSVKQNHGNNEINLYLDDTPQRTTTEIHVDNINQIIVDALPGSAQEPDAISLKIRQPDDSLTIIYLQCRFDLLLAACSAEQMAQQATKHRGELA